MELIPQCRYGQVNPKVRYPCPAQPSTCLLPCAQPPDSLGKGPELSTQARLLARCPHRERCPHSQQPSKGQSSPAPCPGTEPGEPRILIPTAWAQGIETLLQAPSSVTWDEGPKPGSAGALQGPGASKYINLRVSFHESCDLGAAWRGAELGGTRPQNLSPGTYLDRRKASSSGSCTVGRKLSIRRNRRKRRSPHRRLNSDCPQPVNRGRGRLCAGQRAGGDQRKCCHWEGVVQGVAFEVLVSQLWVITWHVAAPTAVRDLGRGPMSFSSLPQGAQSGQQATSYLTRPAHLQGQGFDSLAVVGPSASPLPAPLPHPSPTYCILSPSSGPRYGKSETAGWRSVGPTRQPRLPACSGS